MKPITQNALARLLKPHKVFPPRLGPSMLGARATSGHSSSDYYKRTEIFRPPAAANPFVAPAAERMRT
jgi:hypothetical protein